MTPLKYFGGEDAGHDGLDLVVHAAEGPLRGGHRLLDALLRRAVPGKPWRAHVLGHRAERERHPRGDAAQHHLDLLLENQLPVALDRVLRIGLLLHDELHWPAEDAARLVHALGPPLGAAQAGSADGRGDAGPDGQHADLHRVGWDALLRLGPHDGGKSHRGGHRKSAGTLDERASMAVHALLRDVVWTALSEAASMIVEGPGAGQVMRWSIYRTMLTEYTSEGETDALAGGEGSAMILIIGGMGFIGLNTALRFLEVGKRVVLSQHSARRVPDVLKTRSAASVLIGADGRDQPLRGLRHVRRHQVESIVNLMAPPARSLSTQADYHLYTAGPQNVLEAARTFGLRRVSLGSSVGVYDGFPARAVSRGHRRCR